MKASPSGSERPGEPLAVLQPAGGAEDALRGEMAAPGFDRAATFTHWGVRGISVKTKLLAVVVAACAAVLILTGAAIAVLLQTIEGAAKLEARNLAASVALEAGHRERDLQGYVESLDELYKRDLFILDARRITIGDIVPQEIGTPYNEDRGDEIGQTLRDGQSRAFIEVSGQHPTGAKQMVVPVRASVARDAPIVGVVVLEYTHIAEQLYKENAWTLYAVGLAGLMAVAGIGMGGLRVVRRLGRNIGQIHLGVRAFATGNTAARVPPLDPDEVGDLALAFNHLADDLQRNQRELALEMALVKEAMHHAEILAYTDKLTGLANRTELTRLMERLLPQAEADSKVLGVLFLDLDRFKNVNDTLGHDNGDRLLRTVADRLTEVCGDSAHVCRMGGDEFVILVPGLDAPTWLAGLARRLLIAIAKPVRLQGQEIRTAASIGISAFPIDGRDEHLLMKHADIALYQVKEHGRNDFSFYNASFNHHSVERLAFESELRRAFEQRQLSVHYQPKIGLASGQIDGVEALLRWQHPTMGAVSPVQFIPVAEEIGLIVEIGRWVLEQACRQYVAWRAQGLPPLKMAVNLSAGQFADENLLADVRRVLQETGMDPTALELEITESMLGQDEERCIALLHEFKRMGMKVAVDDFGTGYSSLAKLKLFPIDTLKIDRAFVRDLESNSEDQAIAQAIITIGKSMNMTLVAEGVETEAQLDFLRERGCDLIQGFLFSKALPSHQLAEFSLEQHLPLHGESA
ncbi:EAL domain-containing protein [Roseateles sp.]|uniref:putative bifunctional diguanylate cyclase/phosphodiesterase n=1 Tax=Roseateles sp. TaxID=1971397 RepID=UPI0025FC008B|nr:EAL domain-containing protein [Roseateles sp.]MBV8034740.1 EAL domain-containing protein [Roseateles sp.]